MSEAGSANKAPKEFVPIKSPEEADQMLQEGIRGFVSVLIWSKNQKFMFKSNFKEYNKDAGRLVAAVPKEFDHKLLELELSEAGSQDCYFSVSLSWANIFFKAKYKGKIPAGLSFEVPEQLYKVQRRQDLRLKATEGLVLDADLDDPAGSGSRLTKKVFDLSASGLSLLGQQSESAIFTQGLFITNLVLSVDKKTITVPRAEVRHSRVIELDGSSVLKIGILFKEIRASDAQKIASFVFEESRKYFLKFV